MADGAGFQYPTNFLIMGTQSYSISAAQYAELKTYYDTNDRFGFYIALNKMTGSAAALDMAEISSASGVRGGVAWALNTAYSEVNSVYPLGYPPDEVDKFSEKIAWDDFAQIRLAEDGSGQYVVPSDLARYEAALAIWNDVGGENGNPHLGDQLFPGNPVLIANWYAQALLGNTDALAKLTNILSWYTVGASAASGIAIAWETATEVLADEYNWTQTLNDFIEGYPEARQESYISPSGQEVVVFIDGATGRTLGLVRLGGDTGGGDTAINFANNFVNGVNIVLNPYLDEARQWTTDAIEGISDSVRSYVNLLFNANSPLNGNTFVGTDDADNLSGDAANDKIYGGESDDVLRGVSGNDQLYGGTGLDYLDGGTGSDLLLGGLGADRYDFALSDFEDSPGSIDTIVDSDGQGRIEINSVPFAIGERLSETTWKSLDGNFLVSANLAMGKQTLTIKHIATGSSVNVNDWVNGALGLTLGGTITQPVPNRGEIFGAGNDSGDVHEIVDGQWVDRANESHKLVGNAGNDGLAGGYADDVLEGGDNADYISGGGGADRISGGGGNDYIVNFDGYHTWARWIQVFRDGAYTTIPIEQYISELAASNSDIYSYGNAWYLRANGAQSGDATQFYQNVDTAAWITTYDTNAAAHPDEGDVIDAGEGSDIVFGGRGADIINGGAGNDVLTGGRDGDYISGDDDDDVIFGDRIYGNLDQNWHYGIAEVTGNDLLFGGAGNDKIYGQGGSDTIFGGIGSDLLLGDRYSDDPGAAIEITEAAGDDYIDGGDGDDQILGNAGNDTLLGGSGADLIQGDDIATPANAHGHDTIDAGAGNDTVWGGGGNDTIRGGDGDDILSGDYDPSQLALANHGNDMIFGDAGNDTIIGNGGNDYLDGGADDDTIDGKEGDDRLLGGAGLDQLVGGLGNDVLDGGEGNDKLWGEAGNDRLEGGSGADELQGGEGNDVLDGGTENDKLWGEAGDDRLVGGGGADELQGGDGKDSLDGSDGDDKLWGDAGDDTLEGGAGRDQLVGGVGNDTLNGGADDDILNGNAGSDLLRGGDGNDNLSGNEDDDTVEGGAGNDYVGGDAGHDMLHGNEGNDTLTGGVGNDILTGGEGNDLLVGGVGDDRYHFERGFGTDRIVIGDDEAPGVDTISFGDDIADSDLIYEINGQDLIIRVDGSEDWIEVRGYFSPDAQVGLLFANGGTIDRAQLEQLLGVGASVVGTTGDDTLQGTEGNDRLHGGAGHDILVGQAGDDYLNGGAGNDTIYGSLGDDGMEGGAGNDTYHLSQGFGFDRVLHLGDAGSGSDVIRFDASLTSDMLSSIQISGNDLILGFVYGNPTNPGVDALVLEGFLSAENGTHIIEFADGRRFTASDFLTGGVNWDGTQSADNYVGGDAANNLRGHGGDDHISGLGGNDQIYGGDGNDTLNGDEGDHILHGDNGQDILNGGAGNDQLFGNEYQRAADMLRGGAGDDRYYVSVGYQDGQSPDTVVELEGEGVDTVFADSYSYTLTENVESLVATYTSSTYSWGNPYYPNWNPEIPRLLRGNALDNRIELAAPGWGGTHDGHFYLLDGGLGVDTLIGTTGDEIYVVDQAGDQIIENDSGPNQSIDTVRASYSYSLTSNNLENVQLVGEGDLWAWGNGLGNKLDGSMSSGVNTLVGGEGDDIYLITAKDVVNELSGQGNDTVVINRLDETSAHDAWFDLNDYTHVENMSLGNNTAIDLYSDGTYTGSRGLFDANMRGNSGDNILTGNGFHNEIRGGNGHDTILGGEREGYGNPQAYSDHLYGEAGNDTIHASSGGAHIFGGQGDDQLHGRTRDDYFHYGIGDGRDTITSRYGGTDRVMFADGIMPDDVTWSREGNNLIVQVGDNPSDQIVVLDYWRDYDGESILAGAIEEFVFADGTVRKGDLDQLPYTNNPPTTVIYFHRLDDAVGGETFTYQLPEGTFVDEPGDTLQYSLSPYAPSWLTIDVNTGLITGAPPPGSYYNNVQVIATDTWGQSTYAYFTFTVRNLVEGTAVDDQLIGTSDSDELRGFAGNDRLDGNGSNDRLVGDAGDDTYVIRNGSEIVIEQADEGYDTVEAYSDWTLGEHVERLILAEGGNAYSASAGAGSQTLIGNSGMNYINGGYGADVMQGRGGDDTYVVDDTDDQVIELENEGKDVIVASVDWTLSANVEELYLNSEADLRGTGNALNNVIYGNSGNDHLDGGAGADKLYGRAGNDYYIIDSSQDKVYEYADEGADTIERRYESASNLASDVENLLLGSGVKTGNGNALDNIITGNSGDNRLNGLDGNDLLVGSAGSDTLDGGSGLDRTEGGLGNDTYFIDRTDDVVIELAGEGTDLVQASISFTLSDHVENIALTGTATIDGSGNNLDNQLAGNEAANVLRGLEGNDTLDGNGGSDTLLGGLGDDTYVIEGEADTIIELSQQGYDSVNATISYTLADHAEQLTLGGTNTLNGTGNAGENTLLGNSAANTLTGLAGNDLIDGKGGADTMLGGLGDDTYVVNAAGDLTQEAAGEGIDTVRASVGWTLSANIERMELLGTGNLGGTGNTLDNILVGNSGGNALHGLAGHDVLDGKQGNDTMTGGVGSDSYLMARGYGTDTVVENDATAGTTDIARFLSGVAHDQLWFSRPSGSNNLEISIIGTSDRLVIKNWYLGGQYHVEEIHTDDGNKVLHDEDVQALVNAMAGMTPPPQGQTTLSASQRTTLDPIFASTWRNQPAGAQTGIANDRAAVMAGGSRPDEMFVMGGIHPSIPVDARDGEASPTPVIVSIAPPINGFDWSSEPEMTAFTPGGCDLYESIAASGFRMSDPCGLYEENAVNPISDCRRLIDMMALADRFGPGACMMTNRYGLHIEHLIP